MPQPVGLLTRQDVAARVLRKLNRVAIGRNPSQADAQVIVDHYEELWSEWFGRGYISFGIDQTPLKAAPGIVIALCARTCPDIRGEPWPQSEQQGLVMFLASNGKPVSPAPVAVSYI